MLNQLGSLFPQSKQSFTSRSLKSLSNSVILCAAWQTILRLSDLKQYSWFCTEIQPGLGWVAFSRQMVWSKKASVLFLWPWRGCLEGWACWGWSLEYLHAASSAWRPQGSGIYFVATQGAESRDPADKTEAAWPPNGLAFGVTSTISILLYWRKQS